MKIPLSKTLVIFSVGLSAFPVIVIGVLVWMMNLDVREIVYSEFDKIGARTTRQIVDDTIRICKIIQRTQLDEDERAHEAIAARIGALGVPRLLEKKGKIRAASQMTPTETSDFNVPVMLFGDSPVKLKLASDGTIADASGKVRDTLDQLKRETGLDFCILQRIGTSGAMLRIASTATDPDGQPYVGTYIPATGGYDDGAIVRTLLARKTFSGISRTGSTNFSAVAPFFAILRSSTTSAKFARESSAASSARSSRIRRIVSQFENSPSEATAVNARQSFSRNASLSAYVIKGTYEGCSSVNAHPSKPFSRAFFFASATAVCGSPLRSASLSIRRIKAFVESSTFSENFCVLRASCASISRRRVFLSAGKFAPLNSKSSIVSSNSRFLSPESDFASAVSANFLTAAKSFSSKSMAE